VVAHVGFVRECTAVDSETGACTEMAWVPPVSLGVPDLTMSEWEQLLTACALLLAWAWTWRELGRALDKD
jgi:hypothetical protein